MEKMILVPHHLIILSRLERIWNGHTKEAAKSLTEEIISDNQTPGSRRYAKDIVGKPSANRIKIFERNIKDVMRRYRRRPDSTRVLLGKVGLDDFCLASTGKHLHCESAAKAIGHLPKKHPLAEKFEKADVDLNNRYVEEFEIILHEQPHFDPTHITRFGRIGEKKVADTNLGIVKRVLKETELARWEAIEQSFTTRGQALNQAMLSYASQNKAH